MKKIYWKEHSRKAKTWMRALCMATVAVLGLAACDDDEKSIQFGELPATAQSFLGTYFTGIDAQSIVYDKEDRQYDVVLADGTEVDFNDNGDWLSVDCRFGLLPAGLLLSSMQAAIEEKHPAGHAHSIDKKTSGYEVDITDAAGLEWDMYFDSQGTFVHETPDYHD